MTYTIDNHRAVLVERLLKAKCDLLEIRFALEAKKWTGIADQIGRAISWSEMAYGYARMTTEWVDIEMACGNSVEQMNLAIRGLINKGDTVTKNKVATIKGSILVCITIAKHLQAEHSERR
jgi:hypothetical protein